MKNFFKITSLILLVLFAASCSNGILSNSTYNSQTNDNGKCLVSFTITNFASNARTILPADPTKNDISKYTIEGNSARGEALAATEVEVTDGESSVVLSYDFWQLTLKAYNGEKLLLQATTSVDLSNGISDIIFTLSENGVTTSGSVDLSGTYTDLTSPIVDYTISGLYDIHTGELVEGIAESTEENAGKFAFAAVSVNPGEYIFKVQLCGNGKNGTKGDADDIVYGVWSDVVKVAPDRETAKNNITIPQSVLGSLPTAPSNPMAFLLNGSEAKDDTYKVNLRWTDESNNETHFLIKVYEYSDKDTKIDEVVEEYIVLASITEKEIELKLGKLYDFTVEAVNRLGSSTAVDRVSATDAKTGETAYEITANRINRFKITYNLNGGTYNGKAGNVVEYHTYGDTVTLLQHSVDKPIKIDEYPLQGWVNSDGTDNTTKITNYDGFVNLSVTAQYDLKYVFDVDLPSYVAYELPAGNLAVTADGTAITTGENVDVSSGNKDITLTIGETATINDKTVDYDEFKVILVGGNKTDSNPIDLNGNTYTINTKNLSSDTYIMVAIARAKDTNDWYSASFSFTVER